MGKAPEKPQQEMWRCDKVHLYSPREGFLSHPWRFSDPEWTRQGPPAARWPGELQGSFPPGITLPWSFLQATLDIHQHSPESSSSGGFLPFFPICSQSPGFGSRLAFPRMHLRADKEGFSMTCFICPPHPKGQQDRMVSSSAQTAIPNPVCPSGRVHARSHL